MKINFKKIKRFFLIFLFTIIGMISCYLLIYFIFSEELKVISISQFSNKNLQNKDFAVIRDNTNKGLNDYQRKMIKHALSDKFHDVYFGLNNVPTDKITLKKDKLTGINQIVKLKNGCCLSFEIKKSGFMWFRGYYSIWEGNLSGSVREVEFRWFFGRWRLYKERLVMIA